MGFFLRVALKNVFRQKRRSFTLGVNYAVVTFILVLLFAFSQGAIRNITGNLVRSTAGHITISGSYSIGGRLFLGVRRWPRVETVAKGLFGSDVTVIPRYVVRSTLYYKGDSKRLDFTGVDPAADAALQGQLQFTAGGWDQFASTPNGAVMPKDVAQYFGLHLDDEVVIAARSRYGSFNTGTLKVKGIYESVNFFAQGLILCRFPFTRQLDLAEPDTASTLYLYFRDPSGIAEKRARLAATLHDAGFETTRPSDAASAVDAITSASPTYKADSSGRDTIRLNLSTIDEAVGIVKVISSAVNALGALVALIMMFIIAVSIFINLRMTINDRLQEIGTMRTIGVESGGITALFVLENAFLGLLFSAIGVAAALLVAGLVVGLVRLPPTGTVALFLNQGRLVLVPRVVDIAGVVALVTAFSALFSFFPARRGGRIRPVDALTRVF
ncbi:MAG TPA: FtsX-like permease family protein [Spirochaetia bacterium]|nr:FtsX-like permease family protein [Spirochaetia bacterium]